MDGCTNVPILWMQRAYHNFKCALLLGKFLFMWSFCRNIKFTATFVHACRVSSLQQIVCRLGYKHFFLHERDSSTNNLKIVNIHTTRQYYTRQEFICNQAYIRAMLTWMSIIFTFLHKNSLHIIVCMSNY